MDSKSILPGLLHELAASEHNRIDPGESQEAAFMPPLVGVCPGDDPIWERIAEDIGPFYWTPLQAFTFAHPEDPPKPEELSVVSWVLPQTQATRDEHRAEKLHPSKRWSQVRHHGENFNIWMRRELVARLADAGVKAVAPVLLDQWSREMSDRHGDASTWSERHAAFACGLGTFGLSDGLITAAGKAVRVGSAVVRSKLPATGRPYGENHRAYCLHFAKKSCLACAARCPAKAISAVGHDKVACRRYIREVAAPFVEYKQLGVRVNSCGLCQTGVPCESSIPVKLSRDS